MKRDMWLLLISVFLFAGLAAHYLRSGWVGFLAKKSPAAVVKAAAPQPVPQGTRGQDVAEAGTQREMVDEKSPWGRNPFLSKEEEAKARGSDGLQVKAIILGRARATATVDGRTVVVGEKVGEETVLEIRPDAVVLGKDGQRRVLRVSEPSISVEVKEGRK